MTVVYLLNLSKVVFVKHMYLWSINTPLMWNKFFHTVLYRIAVRDTEEYWLLIKMNVIVLSQYLYCLQPCGHQCALPEIHLNYYYMPSFYVLSCNVWIITWNLLKSMGILPSLLQLPSAAEGRLFCPVHTLQKKNHSEVFSDLMFPFSYISSSLFSISWLHKTSMYMYVYISKQIILTKPWKATSAAIVHANFMLEVCTWRNDNWNACEVPMELYLKKSKVHSSLLGIRKMHPAVHGEASTEWQLFSLRALTRT